MNMDIGETFENPAFWILGGGGSIAVLGGWIMSKKAGWEALPLWQVMVMVIVVLIASAFFANKD